MQEAKKEHSAALLSLSAANMADGTSKGFSRVSKRVRVWSIDMLSRAERDRVWACGGLARKLSLSGLERVVGEGGSTRRIGELRSG